VALHPGRRGSRGMAFASPLAHFPSSVECSLDEALGGKIVALYLHLCCLTIENRIMNLKETGAFCIELSLMPTF
jgi:hypothetical protein